jgi:arsenite/tail-anchored protein-transporting ATPase
LRKDNFLYFAGKGGVGKTTCAAACALARAAAGERVLVVSTDPAHSLGDALGVTLSRTPKAIRPGLDAVEVDAARAFARWVAERRRPLAEILEHGTWLDREDVDALLELSIPGVDELMAIIEIDRLATTERRPRRVRTGRRLSRVARSSGPYDIVVVDTAPTGHTLRLLSAPETVAAVAGVLGALQQEHRLIREQLARLGRPEAADRLIAALAEQARATAAFLRDPDRTAFVWVTLPEDLSLAESADGIAALERTGIHVHEIVVNRVLPPGARCPRCDRRRADERRVLAAIRHRFGRGRTVRIVSAALREPRGLRALAALAPIRAEGSEPRAARPATIGHPGVAIRYPASALSETARATASPADAPGPRSRQPLAVDSEPFIGASLLFFGGKGGVGKTTVAASVALRLARADRKRRVLLLSTDPAHSLGDVFRANVGDTEGTFRGGPPNLMLRELDAARALANRRAQFEGALEEIAAAVGVQGAGAVGTSELMNLAPPGIDELFGVLSVVDARSAYDVIVIDTAPTGHALRLLEMPDAAREWLQVLLRVLLKYRSLVRPGRLAAELVEASRSIRGLIALLRDPETSRFVVVTRAAELPRRETGRLLARLKRLHLSVPAIIVNARTLNPGRCERCRVVAAAERRELARLRRMCRQCAIIQAPLLAPAPRGVRALDGWSRTWTETG